ncbi:MAG: MBOAT family protein [Desulfuromonadaceae bacterium]|nr:MBOAT family protein [Desulfuromonadaceae bacterium]MDD2856286.1 MBOAT family protein [Desulfuromonadaceae bacterium]
MLFNSYEFIFLFLPVTLAVFYLLNRWRLTLASNAWMLFASLFFYCWWDIRYLPLLLASILFNYTIGNLLVDYDSNRKNKVSRKSIFITGIICNLILLGIFKYTDFAITNINAIADTKLELLKIVLPLGISFFTITQIAFLVDCYEGLVKERKLLNYSLFVTFFPHLLAGPILHHKEMMPQFDRTRNKVINYRNLCIGSYVFFIGLFKKIIIADSFSKVVANGFDTAKSLNGIEGWVASLSYTLQLYYDFSGYSDMAVGVGLMFNIVLPWNFNSPYKSTNVIQFWQRWHMTLSSFITTYLYSPILRASKSITFARSLVAIFIAMLISGIWHGAGWNFVLWGSLHGGALVINHYWRKKKLKMPTALACFITFMFVNLSFIFFRAKGIPEALKVLKAMFGMGSPIFPDAATSIKLSDFGHSHIWKVILINLQGSDGTFWRLLAFLIFTFVAKNSIQLADSFKPDWKRFVFLLVIAMYAILNMGKVSEFLYFQF